MTSIIGTPHDQAPPGILPHAPALDARARRNARRHRIAHRRQGRRGSLRRRCSPQRLEQMGGAVQRVASTSAGDHLVARFGSGAAAGAAARPLRHGVADRAARPHAAGGEGRLPPRTRRARHEGRPRARHAGDARASSTLGPLGDVGITMLWTTDEETGSHTSRALIETEAAPQRRRAGARTGAGRRRAQDQPQGLRPVRADGARRVRARRRRPAQGRQRHPRAGAPGAGRGRDSRSRSRHLGERRRDLGRLAAERGARLRHRDGGRPRADDARTPTTSTRRCGRCGR